MPDQPTSAEGRNRRDALRRLMLMGGALIALALLFSTIIQPPVPSALVGEPAPNIPLPLLSGGTFALDSHRGDVVVLDFWATWCTPCRVSMPIADRVVEEYADRGVHLYFINQGEPRDLVHSFTEKSNLRAPMVLDTNRDLGRLYDAHGLPFSVIIGRDGIVKMVRVGEGMNIEHELRADIEAALAE